MKDAIDTHAPNCLA